MKFVFCSNTVYLKQHNKMLKTVMFKPHLTKLNGV